MSGGNAGIPGWQRLLERPRLLHRLATFGLLGAAIVAGVDAFVRGAPDGASQDARYLTYVFDGIRPAGRDLTPLPSPPLTSEATHQAMTSPRRRAR